MRILLFSVLLLMPVFSTAQDTPCPPEVGCECLLQKADALLQGSDPDYERALYLYFAAQACDPALTEMAEQRIVDLFEKIENLRLTAEQRARLIQSQQQELVAEREAAELATRKAIAQRLNVQASRAIDQRDMEEAYRLMRYANAYDPDNLQWLDNLQELFVRNRAGYSDDGFNTPLPARIYPQENFQVLPNGSGYISSNYNQIFVYDWDGKVQSTFDHPHPIDETFPAYSTVISWDSLQTIRIWDLYGKDVVRLSVAGKIEEVIRTPAVDGFAVRTDQNVWHQWDFEGKKLLELSLGEDAIHKVAYSSEGRIISLSYADQLRLFDSLGTELPLPLDDIYDFAVIPNGRGFLAWKQDSVFHLDWRGNILFTSAVEDLVQKITIIDAEKGWICWTVNDDIIHYDMQGQSVHRFDHNLESINDFYVTEYKTKIVIWSEFDCVIWDWEENTTNQVGNITPLMGLSLEGITTLPDFSGFATWSRYEPEVRLWDWEGSLTGMLRTPSYITKVEPLAFPEEGFMVSSWQAGSRKWDWWYEWKDAQSIYLGNHLMPIEEVQLLPESQGFAVRRYFDEETWIYHEAEIRTSSEKVESKPSAGANSVLILNWSGDTLAELPHRGPVLGLQYLDEPFDIYVSWAADSTLRFWNRQFEQTNQIELSAAVKKAHFGGPETLPVFWLESGNLYIPEMGEIALNLTWKATKWLVSERSGIYFWPNGANGVMVYDFEQELRQGFNNNSYSVMGLLEIPDDINPGGKIAGSNFISWSFVEVLFWSHSTVNPQWRIPIGQSGVEGVELHPEGKGFLVWTGPGKIHYYNWDGELQFTADHADRLNGLRFSPGGDRLISWSQNCTVKIWDLQGQQIVQLEHPGNQTSKFCGISGFQFFPNGEGMVSWSADETGFLVWDSKGNAITRLGNQPISDIRFLPNDSNRLIAWSDKEVKIWNINPTQLLEKGKTIGIRDFTAQEKTKYGIDPALLEEE